MLSEDEAERAGRFRFGVDRARFTAARGQLRLILSGYLQAAPQDIRFAYNPHGKPHLAAQDHAAPLYFNLSHSQGLGLLGVARIPEIGVDLECLERAVEIEQISRRFFTPAEAAALAGLPAAQQREAFFQCWTRKEAYLKAKGSGLVVGLNQFEVTLGPGKPARLIRASSDPHEASYWSLQELKPAGGYIAALAVRAPIRQIHCWDFHPPAPPSAESSSG